MVYKAKIVLVHQISGEKLTLHQEDLDKYQEHKRIIELGIKSEIEAHNKKMTN